ncbi:jg23753 [Pararge aegeria aegeria]|uniref:Jg23753 protein n=1 Tax=Pararge aegeria aegeria TaxID=348720 RepID=A0A8S4SGL1_9NEOP|nr:jg23753 [Pararge aegeria aegeria]
MSENSCKHMVMNGGINFVSSQSVDPPQLTAVLAPNVKAGDPYDKPDLEYKDGHIITATFDALVEVLRPGASKPYVFTFLLCSRLFVKPHELLAKLCKRYFKNYEKVGDIITLGLTPVELANQLTNVELHRLSYVGPEEFVQTFAPSQPAQSTSTKNINIHHAEAKSTKNLEAYTDWFNRLSYLVATDILKAVKSKYRARVMEQWVMTARECFNLGNFNSLMAIVGALNMAPIARLKKTVSKV